MNACRMLTWVALKMTSLVSVLSSLIGSAFPGERRPSRVSRLSLHLSALIGDKWRGAALFWRWPSSAFVPRLSEILSDDGGKDVVNDFRRRQKVVGKSLWGLPPLSSNCHSDMNRGDLRMKTLLSIPFLVCSYLPRDLEVASQPWELRVLS